MEKLKLESADLTEQNIDKIAALFPNVITETKDADGNIKKAINFTLLQQMLQADLVEGDENYEFTWVGKKQSIIEGNKPIRKTLRPFVEESKNWDKTENLYIEGDNLEVLKLLQGSYLNSIKIMYIDPPYNTGKDFVYKDNFTVSKDDYEEDLGMFDENDNRLFLNSESNGRFHSDWCSMIYPRLQLAQNLLAEDGVIFISIGEHEVANLKKMCCEIFSEYNFIENYVWESTFRPDNSSKILRRNAEYVICISKDITKIKQFIGESKEKEGLPSLTKSSMKESILKFPSNTVKTFLKDGLYKKGIKDTYELLEDVIVESGVIINSFSLKGRMIWGQDYLNKEILEGTEIIIKGDGFVPYTKKSGDSVMSPTKLIPNHLVGDVLSANAEMSVLFENKVFSYPKPVSLIKYLVKYIPENDITVLDFFSGSATIAQAVMELNMEDNGNRKFICVQLPEDLDENYKKATDKEKVIVKNAIDLCDELNKKHFITEIAKERIRRASTKIESEQKARKSDTFQESVKPVDTGFRVLKLDTTNMKDVYYGAGEYNQQMLLDLESNIKPDRTDLDLLYGVLLDWGVSLALPHTNEMIGGVKVHFVNGVDLVACFADNVTEEVIREIAKRKPLRVVFRDSSFANSPDKINVTEIFKTLSPETTVKVI